MISKGQLISELIRENFHGWYVLDRYSSKRIGSEIPTLGNRSPKNTSVSLVLAENLGILETECRSRMM